ncbi:efflux transporter outer membrane subunit [Myxococcota bacterium]|nr:efflux transporter outer membrane subunit [Myxococcota bacterium]
MTSCRVHSPELEPEAPLAPPEAFSTNVSPEAGPEAGPQAALKEANHKFWEEFEDPKLNALVEQALSGNFKMQGAVARLEQVEAIAIQMGSMLWPTISAEGSGAVQPTYIPMSQSFSNIERYGASVKASYELDLWGKARNQKDAARFDAMAVQENLVALGLSVAAETTEAYFDTISYEHEVRLLQAQLNANQTYLDLTRLRVGEGLASMLDFYQQEQQLASVEGQLAQLRATTILAHKRLSVMLGKMPGEAQSEEELSLPSLPLLPKTGVPSEVLLRRPDIRAARLSLISADARVGVAIADALPSLRLSGSLIYQSTELATLFAEMLWSAVASVTQPIFEGGRRMSEIDVRKAAFKEAVSNYGQAMVEAILEVESALVQEKHEKERMRALQRQVKSASAALVQARARYEQGLNDYLPVLTALRGKQSSERTLVASQRRVLSLRVSLYRALGGGLSELLPTMKNRGASDD